MREFKTSFDNTVVDLDDPKTYENYPDNEKDLDDMMFKYIGYALCYMNFWYKETFGKSKYDGGQKKRVNNLIQNFCDNRRDNYHNKMWYKEQIFLFEDETENMC